MFDPLTKLDPSTGDSSFPLWVIIVLVVVIIIGVPLILIVIRYRHKYVVSLFDVLSSVLTLTYLFH